MLKISEAIRSTSNQDGTILLDIRHGRILGLNRMGSAVFRMLERGLEPAEIAGEISRDFPANAEQVRTDVLGFIESLKEHNVLRIC
jgi:coenzyme PQQ synthesis protein D (PqqD)